MNSRRFFCAVFSTLIFIGFLPTTVSAGDLWTKVKSKNFQLYGNATEKEIGAAAVKLEQFREAFRQIFPRVKSGSAIPTNVIVFKDTKSFRNYKLLDENGKPLDWIAGYFQSGEDANYIAFSVEGEQSDVYQTIFHEYSHFLVNNDLGQTNIPAWFNEGIAEYYEQLTIENDQKVTLGRVDGKNLSLLQQNKLIPLETFFGIDNYSLNRQDNDGVGLFYAQAWALMHYLIQGNNGAKNAQLSAFINLILSGKPPKDAFNEAFQIDYAAMEKDFKKYIEQKSFRVQTFDLKEKLKFDADLKTFPMSEAEAQAVLGDLLYHSNRLNEAETHLKNALALNPNLSIANASLGVVKTKQQNFVEAKKYLEKAIRLDDKNYLNFYRYAYALSREGMTDFGFVSNYNGEQAFKMREALDKSIELNPNFAESYNLYAFVGFVRNEELDEALEYIDKAIALAPGNQWYRLRSAEIYLRKEDFNNARQIARKIYETAPDEHLRVYVKNTISLIDSYQAQLEKIKNSNRFPQTSVTDKILTEEEIARLNEQAMLEAVNQALRRPKADEKRILGYLVRVDCGKNVKYSIKTDEGTLNLISESFDGLFLMKYTSESNGEIGCGMFKAEILNVITYRPQPDAKNKTAGELKAIESVPKNFKFLSK